MDALDHRVSSENKAVVVAERTPFWKLWATIRNRESKKSTAVLFFGAGRESRTPT
jgi:hypothetical protein